MRVTSFTPGSTLTPPAGPTHSTGPSDGLGDGLADGLAVALGLTVGLADGDGDAPGLDVAVGLADGLAVALGLTVGLAVELVVGLALTVSGVDALFDGDGSGVVSSEPVRASSVTSVVGEDDGSDAGD